MDVVNWGAGISGTLEGERSDRSEFVPCSCLASSRWLLSGVCGPPQRLPCLSLHPESSSHLCLTAELFKGQPFLLGAGRREPQHSTFVKWGPRVHGSFSRLLGHMGTSLHVLMPVFNGYCPGSFQEPGDQGRQVLPPESLQQQVSPVC